MPCDFPSGGCWNAKTASVPTAIISGKVRYHRERGRVVTATTIGSIGAGGGVDIFLSVTQSRSAAALQLYAVFGVTTKVCTAGFSPQREKSGRNSGPTIQRVVDNGLDSGRPMALDYQQFQRLALAELPVVNRVARAMTRSPNDADDLTQETFLKAIRSWSSFELREAGIRPWLMTILNRTHLNRIRQTKRQSAYVDHADVEELASSPSVASADNGLAVDWNQFDGHLLSALGRTSG
jgi:hypothetical protein